MKISIKYKDKNFELLNVSNQENLLERVERISGLIGVTPANLGLSDEEKITDGMSYELKPEEIQYVQGSTYVINPIEERKTLPPQGSQTNNVIMDSSHRHYLLLLNEFNLTPSNPVNMRNIHKWLADVKELHLPYYFTRREYRETQWQRLYQCMSDYSHIKIIFPEDKVSPIESVIFSIALSLFFQFNILSVFVGNESDAKIVIKSIEKNRHSINHLRLQAFNLDRNIRVAPLMNSLLGLGLQQLTVEYPKFKIMNDANSKALAIFLSESKSLRKLKVIGLIEDLLQFTGWLEAIIKNPLLTHLEMISCRSYSLNQTFITALANVLNKCQLQFLKIDGLIFQDEQIKILESQLSDNHFLNDLHLRNCNIQYLDSILRKFPALTKLDLSDNLITNSGLKKLMQLLPSLTVTDLDLSENKITSIEILKEFLPVLPLRKLRIAAPENYPLMQLNGSITVFKDDDSEEKTILRNQKLVPILTNFLTYLFKIIDQNILPQVLLKIIIEYWSEDIIKARFANFLNLFFSTLVSAIGCKNWDLSKNKRGYVLFANDASKTREAVIHLENLLNTYSIKADYNVFLSDNAIEIYIPLEEIFKFYIRIFQHESKAQNVGRPYQYASFEKILLFHKNQALSQPTDEKPTTGCIIA